MEYLDIIPFRNEVSSEVYIPGSKSISNRALILASLCRAKTTLSGILNSEDVALMIAALSKLGIQVSEDDSGKKLIVCGNGGQFAKEATINVGNAGTVARFLTAALAFVQNGEYHLDGTSAMRLRPMSELLESLKRLGCLFKFSKSDGCFPFTMRTNGLSGDSWGVDARQSSQVLSALMMVAPLVNHKTAINFDGGTVSKPFLGITERMMESFSTDEFQIKKGKESLTVISNGYTAEDLLYEIEPDATAASYFLTLPIVAGGNLLVNGIKENMLQGDAKYIKILRELGGEMVETDKGMKASFSKRVKGGNFDFNDISDTFLTLAAISPVLAEPTRIYGIKHTRKQETDRVRAMATEIRKLNQEVVEQEDSLEIKPDLNKLKAAASKKVIIDTYEDHRVAMSFAILGSYDLFGDGKSWMRIKNPMCCSKTFPDFFHVLEKLRAQSQ